MHTPSTYTGKLEKNSMKSAHQFLIVSIASSLMLNACSQSTGNSDEINNLKQEVESLKQENAQLKVKLANKDNAATPVATQSQEPVKSNTASTESTTEAAKKAQTFQDIDGVFGEKEIKALAGLKVIDADSPNFEPTKPISRAEFVEWLVKANNAIRPSKYLIRKAEKDAASSFSDLSNSQKYFQAIQGMSDAGWSVGFTDKTFRPEANLTREQLIAIKSPLDYQQKDLSNYLEKWQDNAKISKNFKESMNLEAFSGHNWERVFGKTKNCDPQKPVTRAEAAVCLYQFTGGSNDYNASEPQGAS